MRILLVIFLCFCLSGFLNGQLLDRKASLGAQIGQTENGMKVVRAVEGTSIELKLKPDDVILEINKIKIDDYATLISAISSKVDNETVEITAERNNKIVKLKGKCVGRPFEKSENSEIIYD